MGGGVPVVPHKDIPGAGTGRMGTLDTTASLHDVILRVKKELNLKHVRVSLATKYLPGKGSDEIVSAAVKDVPVTTVGVCGGSGFSVLSAMKSAPSLFVSGEMGHHEVLTANEKGTSVILTDHSNSERGWLQVYKRYLFCFCFSIDRDALVETLLDVASHVNMCSVLNTALHVILLSH